MTLQATFAEMLRAYKPTDTTVVEDARLEDTIALIVRKVPQTLWQTRELATALRGGTVRETCRNVWDFCKRNFQYRQDKRGYEQVRSPRRAVHDRHAGIDCDCFTFLISSILTNLAIRHKLRITKYPDPERPGIQASEIEFSHIYVVATDGGREVKIDPVTDSFDYEVPFLTKRDIPMTLQYLDGPPGRTLGSVDQIDLGLGNLGLFKKKAKPKPNERTNQPSTLAPPNPQKGKGAHAINRFNPAAVLLRTGILLGMKLNMFNVGSQLRFAYLTDAQAQSRGLNMKRMAHLRKIHAKLEHAVFLGGGQPENLKKAILEGKGNHDKAVPLNGLGMPSPIPLGYGSDTPVHEILGPVIYQSEVAQHLNGLGSLGEPVTASAAIAAATAMLGTIAALLKSVGDVKAGGEPGAAAAGDVDAMAVPEYSAPGDPQAPAQSALPAPSPETAAPVPYEEPGTAVIPEDDAPTVETSATDPGASQRTSNTPAPTTDPPKKGVVQWAKDNPIIAFGVIPAAAIALGLVIWKAVQKPKKSSGAVNGLEGKPKGRKKAGGKGKAKKGGGKRRANTKGGYKLML